MKLTKLIAPLTGVLALVAATAPIGNARTLVIVEFTSELRLAYVDFPITSTGSVAFRLCGNCESHTMPVTPETDYLTDAGILPQADFLAEVTRIRLTQTGNQTTAVFLTYNAETHVITRIRLDEGTLSPG